MNHDPRFFIRPRLFSALLPPDARMALARAAFEAQNIADPLQREMVIEAAIARVRLQYPTYFKE
jgi:hypothetical protein